MIQKLILLGVAGAFGTLARYGLANFVQNYIKLSFPMGTLVVNIIGCLVVGLLWALFESRWQVSSETQVLVLVGFMGAFTTFSAFIMESGSLMQSSAWIPTIANILLQNGLGFGALFVGIFIGRSI